MYNPATPPPTPPPSPPIKGGGSPYGVLVYNMAPPYYKRKKDYIMYLFFMGRGGDGYGLAGHNKNKRRCGLVHFIDLSLLFFYVPANPYPLHNCGRGWTLVT